MYFSVISGMFVYFLYGYHNSIEGKRPKSVELEFEPLPSIPVTQTDANLPLKKRNGDKWREYVETSKTFLQALKKRAGVDRELLVLTFLLFLKFSLCDILVDNWSEISLTL